MNSEELWSKGLQRIQQRISKASYDTWFKSTRARSMKDSTLIVEANNEFQRDWLEKQFTNLIEEILGELIGGKVEINFVVAEEMIATRPTRSQSEDVNVYELLRKIEKIELRVSELEDVVDDLKNKTT